MGNKILVGSNFVGFKNRIINGDFSVWQRGENCLYGTPDAWVKSTDYSVGDIVIPTTANNFYYECTVAGTSDSSECAWPTAVGSTVTDNSVTWECKGFQYLYGYHTADRVVTANNTDGEFIVTKSSINGSNSVKFNVNKAVTDLTKSKLWNGVEHRFEGNHIYNLAINKKNITISFLFNSNVTGKYSIALRNATDTSSQIESYVTTFDYTTANTPQKIEVQISLNHSFNPVLLNNCNVGFNLVIGYLNQGDNVTSTTNQWQDGDYLTTSDCVNWGATAGNFIEIAELQLEEGNVATSFEYIPFDVQMQRCMRYYEFINNYKTGEYTFIIGEMNTDTQAMYVLRYMKEKRILPTIIFNDGYMNNYDGTGQLTKVDSSHVNNINNGTSSVRFTLDNLASGNKGDACHLDIRTFKFMIDAEL